VRRGAFEYLLKPFDLSAVQRVIERAAGGDSHRLESNDASPTDLSDASLIGRSAAMQEVFKRIALVAPSDACVHLCGESGTGKELAARAIHRYSRRAAGPFVAVHAASLSPSLAESELFGHARGAFTGADRPHKGLLEQADGGTLFFDEVADVPPALQVKLLRVLELGEILPVGADRPVQSDFRLISATHQDLRRRVAEGQFRHDLYYRLITFEIEMPPLRERGDDIVELATCFLTRLAQPIGQNHSGVFRPALSAAALAELRRRPWWGNVRELRGAIEHAMILARGGPIAPEHLPPPLAPAAATDPAATMAATVRQWAAAQIESPEGADDLYERFLKFVEPPLFETVMRHCGGQCQAAARRLGLHRSTLRKKLDAQNL